MIKDMLEKGAPKDPSFGEAPSYAIKGSGADYAKAKKAAREAYGVRQIEFRKRMRTKAIYAALIGISTIGIIVFLYVAGAFGK